MKTHANRYALLLLTPLAFVPVSHVRATPGDCTAKAVATIEALARHDHDGARRDLDPQLRANSQQMEPMWDALVRQNWGPYRSRGAAESTTNGDRTTVRLPLEFDHGQTTATVTCDPKEGGAIVEFSLL